MDQNRFPENQFTPIDLKIYREKKEQEKKKNEEQKKKKVVKETTDEEIKTSSENIQASTLKATPPLTSRRDLKTTSQEQENSGPEIQETIAQVMSTRDKSTRTISRSKSVIEIFTETLKSSNQKNSVQNSPEKKFVKTRLKPESYGEVLTAEEVVDRLEKAEAEKQLKEKENMKNKKEKG